MLVDVIRLRIEGRKIPRGELAGVQAVRGELTIVSAYDAHRGKGQSVAHLVDSDTQTLLPSLDQVRITRLRGSDFVLSGIETIEHRRKDFEHYPQAWWCKIVPDARKVSDQDPTIDDLEALMPA